MKTLIIYASKYGATAQIVQCLASKLGESVTIKDIRSGKPHLKDYDAVIIGGSIYMNTIQKRITSFLKANEKELATKKLGLFIGCYTPPDTAGYLEQFFPQSLLAVAKAKAILGGLMQYDKMNVFYRTVFMQLKKIDGFNKEFKEPQIEIGQIEKFAASFLT